MANRIETPYIPNLIGGAEAFGLLPESVARSIQGFAAKTAPSDAKAALMLSDRGPAGYDEDYFGFDWLYVINMRSINLTNPGFGAGADHYINALREGGYENDPLFGGRLELLDSLDPFSVYATLVPTGTRDYCFVGGGLNVSCVENLSYLDPVFIEAAEPRSLAIVGLGLGILVFLRRRQKPGPRHWDSI